MSNQLKQKRGADKRHYKWSDSSSSSSSSSSCSGCHTEEKKCEVKCCLPKCERNLPKGLSAFEACCKLRAAVVDIASTAILTAEAYSTDPVIADMRSYTVYGNGFFIDKHYILAPSVLAVIPPTVLSTNNRVPFTSTSVVAPGVAGVGRCPEEVVQMSTIKVTVHNWNGRADPSSRSLDGHSVALDARVVMVDGAGGYALLKLDCSEWNNCILEQFKCKCHPKLCFEDSCKVKCGDKAYLLGNVASAGPPGTGPAVIGISKGVVKANHAADPTGWFLPEMIVVDADAESPNLGMPLLNQCGKVIGMQLSSLPGFTFTQLAGAIPSPGLLGIGDGAVGAVSEMFMRAGIRATMVLGKCQPSASDQCLLDHLGTVTDLGVGDFYKYLKGYLGVAYNMVNANNFADYLADPATGARNMLWNSLGQLYSGPADKVVRGVRVLTLAGDATIGYAAVPGTAPAVPYPAAGTVDSPLTGKVLPEDQLIGIKQGTNCSKGCTLGQGSYKIVPAVYTWQTLPNVNSVVLSVRRPNEIAGVAQSNHLDEIGCVLAKVGDFPPVMDYMWGLINKFPLIGDPGNPAPQALLLENPQLPALNFHPAF